MARKELEKEGIEAKSGKDWLRTWEKMGRGGGAVAVYGGANAVLRKCLAQKQVPSYQSEELLDYQKELLEKGYLYYALPLIESMGKTKLAAEILRALGDGKGGGGCCSEEVQVRDTARGYALWQSVETCFREKTGGEADFADIAYLGLIFCYPDFTNYARDTKGYNRYALESEVEFNKNEGAVKEIIGRVGLPRLKEILPMCLARRGVLLYFNNSFIRGGRVMVGVEDEGEIIVLARRPLPVSVISGVEILSDVDRGDLEIAWELSS